MIKDKLNCINILRPEKIREIFGTFKELLLMRDRLPDMEAGGNEKTSFLFSWWFENGKL
jgi:hypothetical protein